MTKKSNKANQPKKMTVVGSDDQSQRNGEPLMSNGQKAVIDRTLKCQKLADTLFKDVERHTKEHGTLSIFELNDVFIKLIHSYNKQMLMKEYSNLNDPDQN